jgi:hypothetical protein
MAVGTLLDLIFHLHADGAFKVFWFETETPIRVDVLLLVHQDICILLLCLHHSLGFYSFFTSLAQSTVFLWWSYVLSPSSFFL